MKPFVSYRNDSAIATKGGIIVDAAFGDALSRYSWGLDSDGYPKAKIHGAHIRLHQLVAGRALPGHVIDHINQNKLDNRACNLRHVTFRENALNSNRLADGVWFNTSKNRWQAQHKVNGVRLHIGTFKTQEEAITARAIQIELLRSAQPHTAAHR